MKNTFTNFLAKTGEIWLKKKAVNSLIFKESLSGSECSYADISRFLKRINQEPHRHAGSQKKQASRERAREKKIVWTNSGDGFKFPPSAAWRVAAVEASRWAAAPRASDTLRGFGAIKV